VQEGNHGLVQWGVRETCRCKCVDVVERED